MIEDDEVFGDVVDTENLTRESALNLAVQHCNRQNAQYSANGVLRVANIFLNWLNGDTNGEG